MVPALTPRNLREQLCGQKEAEGGVEEPVFKKLLKRV